MKYAPANEAGQKPYVVEWRDWNRVLERVIYADGAPDARYRAIGRKSAGVHVRSCRRATPGDIERLA